MTVHFAEPPAALRIGGLDAAIRALESALTAHGINVMSGSAETAQCGDVVHFHGLWRASDAHLSLALRKRGVPFLVSPHGMLEPWAWRHKWWKKWPYFWLVERAHLRRSSCLLATAPQEERRLHKFLPDHQIVTLPLGFTGEASPDYAAAREKLAWGSEESVLLFLSRLHVKKGVELLLHALKGVDYPASAKTRLVIVGGGNPSYVRRLRALAETLPIRVDWIGEIWGDSRWPYFQGADLFCLPTYSENFGLAVLEACQVGTPTLTTNTTPWSEWLPKGHGFIVEPKTPGVIRGLREFFARPKPTAEDRMALAEWSQREFSWSSLAPRYVALYRRLQGQAA